MSEHYAPEMENPPDGDDFGALVGDDPNIDYLTTISRGAHDVMVHTLEGPLNMSPGDWVIKGVKGEFYPCKPDVFSQTYEAVSPDAE